MDIMTLICVPCNIIQLTSLERLGFYCFLVIETSRSFQAMSSNLEH